MLTHVAVLLLAAAVASASPVKFRYLDSFEESNDDYSFRSKGSLTRLEPIRIIKTRDRSSDEGFYGRQDSDEGRGYRPAFSRYVGRQRYGSGQRTYKKIYQRPRYGRTCGYGQFRSAYGNCVTSSLYKTESKESAPTIYKAPAIVLEDQSDEYGSSREGKSFQPYPIYNYNHRVRQKHYNVPKSPRPVIFVVNYNSQRDSGESSGGSLISGADLRSSVGDTSVDDLTGAGHDILDTPSTQTLNTDGASIGNAAFDGTADATPVQDTLTGSPDTFSNTEPEPVHVQEINVVQESPQDVPTDIALGKEVSGATDTSPQDTLPIFEQLPSLGSTVNDPVKTFGKQLTLEGGENFDPTLAAEVEEIEPAEPREVEAPEVEAADIEAADLEAAEIEAADIEATEVEAGEIEAADVEVTEVEEAEVEVNEVETAEVEPALVDVGEPAEGEIADLAEVEALGSTDAEAAEPADTEPVEPAEAEAGPAETIEFPEAEAEVADVAEAELTEVVEAAVAEAAEAEFVEEAEAELSEISEAEAVEVAEAVVAEVAEAEFGEIAEAEVGQITEVGEIVEAEVGEIAEAEVGEIAEAEVGEIAEAEVGEIAEAGEILEAEVGEIAEAEVGEIVEAEIGSIAEADILEVGEAEIAEVDAVDVPVIDEAEVAEVAEAEVVEEIDAELAGGAESEIAEVGGAEPDVVEVPEAEIVEASEAEIAEVNIGEVSEVAEVEEIVETELVEVDEAGIADIVDVVDAPEPRELIEVAEVIIESSDIVEGAEQAEVIEAGDTVVDAVETEVAVEEGAEVEAAAEVDVEVAVVDADAQQDEVIAGLDQGSELEAGDIEGTEFEAGDTGVLEIESSIDLGIDNVDVEPIAIVANDLEVNEFENVVEADTLPGAVDQTLSQVGDITVQGQIAEPEEQLLSIAEAIALAEETDVDQIINTNEIGLAKSLASALKSEGNETTLEGTENVAQTTQVSVANTEAPETLLFEIDVTESVQLENEEELITEEPELQASETTGTEKSVNEVETTATPNLDDVPVNVSEVVLTVENTPIKLTESKLGGDSAHELDITVNEIISTKTKIDQTNESAVVGKSFTEIIENVEALEEPKPTDPSDILRIEDSQFGKSLGIAKDATNVLQSQVITDEFNSENPILGEAVEKETETTTESVVSPVVTIKDGLESSDDINKNVKISESVHDNVESTFEPSPEVITIADVGNKLKDEKSPLTDFIAKLNLSMLVSPQKELPLPKPKSNAVFIAENIVDKTAKAITGDIKSGNQIKFKIDTSPFTPVVAPSIGKSLIQVNTELQRLPLKTDDRPQLPQLPLGKHLIRIPLDGSKLGKSLQNGNSPITFTISTRTSLESQHSAEFSHENFRNSHFGRQNSGLRSSSPVTRSISPGSNPFQSIQNPQRGNLLGQTQLPTRTNSLLPNIHGRFLPNNFIGNSFSSVNPHSFNLISGINNPRSTFPQGRSVLPGPTQIQNLRTLQNFPNLGLGRNMRQFLFTPRNLNLRNSG